jgi:hypothetical protein
MNINLETAGTACLVGLSGMSIELPLFLRILVRDYFDEQRTVPLACVLELLLIRPAGRTSAITVHPAEPPFRVHFPDGYLCGSTGLGLGKANCGYKFHVNRRSATFGAALPPP